MKSEDTFKLLKTIVERCPWLRRKLQAWVDAWNAGKGTKKPEGENDGSHS